MIDPNRTCGTCALYSESARPGENKAPRGGWCLAPVPAWARVAMDDARTLPTRGARCPTWTAKPSAVDPRQTTSVPDLLACLERLRGECAGLLFAHRAAIAEDGGTWTIEILEQCMAAAAAAIAKSEGQTSLIPEVTR